MLIFLLILISYLLFGKCIFVSYQAKFTSFFHDRYYLFSNLTQSDIFDNLNFTISHNFNNIQTAQALNGGRKNAMP